MAKHEQSMAQRSKQLQLLESKTVKQSFTAEIHIRIAKATVGNARILCSNNTSFSYKKQSVWVPHSTNISVQIPHGSHIFVWKQNVDSTCKYQEEKINPNAPNKILSSGHNIHEIIIIQKCKIRVQPFEQIQNAENKQCAQDEISTQDSQPSL